MTSFLDGTRCRGGRSTSFSSFLNFVPFGSILAIDTNYSGQGSGFRLSAAFFEFAFTDASARTA
jgi:hypothetical protein